MMVDLHKVIENHALFLSGKGGEKADLSGADLREADLTGADLSGANLRWADLSGADLSGAVLSGADLSGAVLSGADLSGADLSGAVLSGAVLYRADLSGADLPDFQIPQHGPMVGWKKLTNQCLAKLEIPENARRTATPIGRKCRAEFVKVLELSDGDQQCSLYNDSFLYKSGDIVHPDGYNDDIRIECTNGIHFFLTKEEAEKYQY